MRRGLLGSALVALALSAWPSGAAGAEASEDACSHVVVLTLPGITWAHVREAAPPALLAATRAGSVGSISVRTNAPRTTYASGFATLGAGARLDGARTAGGPAAASDVHALEEGSALRRGVVAAGLAEMRQLAAEADYGARPGALGSALDGRTLAAAGNGDAGSPPPLPTGFGRWSLLAAMDAQAGVDLSATGPDLLRPEPGAPFGVATDGAELRAAVDAVLARPCASLIVDHGDLVRADLAALMTTDESEARSDVERALRRADELLAHLRDALDPQRDLLLVLSPTSPAAAPEAQLGVALAVGPGYASGTALQSASTRRSGLVTLTDVAPTVLEHLGIPRPASMNGRPWYPVEARSSSPIEEAVDLNAEAVFVDRLKPPVTTAFIVSQVLAYLVLMPLVARRAPRSRDGSGRAAELAALAAVAFPLSTYLAGLVPAHELGVAGFAALLVGITALLLAAVAATVSSSLDRLLLLVGLTTAVLVADLVLAQELQLNTVFGYSPIVAGRFSGAGNIAFAVLGASSLLTGTLIVHRWSNRRAALAAAAALFVVVVVVDGAPQFGSDVGGTLALVPAFGVTWLLLSGRRPNARTLFLSALAAVALLAVFVAVDLSRSPQERTHLARLFEDAARRGVPVVVDTVERKARANLRVFRSTVYTFFVPPALGVLAWLLRRPRGRWERLAHVYPRLRAGLIGGLLLAVLGFAVNDSGIVIPAVILTYLVPTALLIHLALERQPAEDTRA